MVFRKTRRAVRKASRTKAKANTRRTTKTSRTKAKRPSKTMKKGKAEVFKATKSLARTLSSARNRAFSNTVDYLLKHMQKEIRAKNRTQAKTTFDCLAGVVINSPPGISDEVKNNLFAVIDRVGSKNRVAKTRYIDTPKHHCVYGKCKDHRSKTCRAIIVNNRYVGCMNKP